MSQQKSPTTNRLDRAAVFLSGLCLLHCLAVPFALLLGPALGQWLDSSESQVHWVLLALALPISGIALWRGYVKNPSPLTLALGGFGLAFMLLGVSHVFGDAYEIAFTVIGVVMLLSAHLRNMTAGHTHA